MTSIEITVPLLKGAKFMSANDRPNRWDKARATALWRGLGYAAGREARQSFTAIRTNNRLPVRIIATVHIADKRRREVSNLFPTFKACIDGFVSAGLLVDDSDAHVVGPDPRRAYDGPPRITFELEEVAS